VFAAGWTLDAAEQVGAGGELAEIDILDVLSRLVEKSLAVMDGQGDRYRLLETVRQYAQDRLGETAEGDAVRTRHLTFYLGLAETARAELVGPNQGEWLARLDTERENLLIAHRWCDRADDGGTLGLRLVFSIKLYWLNRGLLGLGQRITVEALDRPGARRDIVRCRALQAAGQFAYFMGHYDEALPYLDDGLAIARELGDNSRVTSIMQAVGMAFLGKGDLPTARRQLEEALALAHELGNKRDLAAALNALAQLCRVEGTLDVAEPLFRQVLELARELDDRESIAVALLNLAMVAIGREHGEDARTMLLDVLNIADEIGSKAAGLFALVVCAGLAATRNQFERAARYFGAAEAQTGQTGLQRDPADEAFLMPLMAQTRAALDIATFAAAKAAGSAMGYNQAVADAHAWLATSRS
jgi:tetratricopeptide (TPR) repeat protein